MALSTPDVDVLLMLLSEERHLCREAKEHPSPERLSAYLANELSPEEDDVVQEHFAGCKVCSELLLDLAGFFDPSDEGFPQEGIVGFEVVAEWRELRQRILSRRLSRRICSVAAIAAALLLFLDGPTHKFGTFLEDNFSAHAARAHVATLESPAKLGPS